MARKSRLEVIADRELSPEELRMEAIFKKKLSAGERADVYVYLKTLYDDGITDSLTGLYKKEN